MYDNHAACRFSLAFQCIVNIGVRGSEPIRSRVDHAGVLDVVGCILDAWLRGFAIGPTLTTNDMSRETREQRQARCQQQAELRQREQAAVIAWALEHQIAAANTIARHVEVTAREVSPCFFLGGEGVYDAWPRKVADCGPPWVQEWMQTE